MNELPLESLWVYLSGSPLLSLTLTLAVYLLTSVVFERSGRQPWLNPVLWSVILLVAWLEISQIPYEDYFEGAQFIHFLLGPATVSLAIPLFRELSALRRRWFRIGISLVAGLTTTIGSTLLIGYVLGLDRLMLLSITPKSSTAPVAMGIAERIGGLPSLTAVVAVLTGVIGAVIAVPVLRVLRIRDDSAKGLAIGLVAHGIGTARAFQISERAGAYSGLSMALSATLSAITIPWVVSLLWP